MLQTSNLWLGRVFSSQAASDATVSSGSAVLASATGTQTIRGSFWQNHSLLQQTTTQLQDPKDTVLPSLTYTC